VGVHLADWPGRGNGPAGGALNQLFALSKAPKAWVTRSNRVGCARKAGAGGCRDCGGLVGLSRRVEICEAGRVDWEEAIRDQAWSELKSFGDERCVQGPLPSSSESALKAPTILVIQPPADLAAR
jgi:hypothetical protein